MQIGGIKLRGVILYVLMSRTDSKYFLIICECFNEKLKHFCLGWLRNFRVLCDLRLTSTSCHHRKNPARTKMIVPSRPKTSLISSRLNGAARPRAGVINRTLNKWSSTLVEDIVINRVVRRDARQQDGRWHGWLRDNTRDNEQR